jgi:putative membrane protein
MVHAAAPIAQPRSASMRLILRWVITAVALAAAAYLIPGIHVAPGQDGVIAVVIVAAMLGLVNAFVRPVLTMLSCGFIVLTLGLFLLVINALMLMLAAWLSENIFNAGFRVDGFWAALFGSIVVSIVSFLLSMVLPDEERAVV